jgi:hypothetical protein
MNTSADPQRQNDGVEGHRWHLHRTFGTHLPCRIVCGCGWTSTAGHRATVLLELKSHLEDCLHRGAALLRANDQPRPKLPHAHSA